MPKSRSAKKTPTSSLRIIGGAHRGRKLPIPDLDGLRPTSNRIRETLFNWLQFDLPGLTVLDLFAGTGALGLEALSRDAKHTVFVEPQSLAARGILSSLGTLGLNNAQVVTQTSEQFLKSNAQSFDLVFVDPPFAADAWTGTLRALVDGPHLAENAWVYVESPKGQVFEIPEQLETIKDKTTGKVQYRLLRMA